MRDRHRAGTAEPELAARLLLKGRRGEWTARALGERSRLHRRNRERRVAQATRERFRLVGVQEDDFGLAVVGCRRELTGGGIEVAAFRQPATVKLHQPGAEGLVLREELGLEVAPLTGAETHAGAFPLHHHTDRDALHASGRRGLAATEHPPQHR